MRTHTTATAVNFKNVFTAIIRSGDHKAATKQRHAKATNSAKGAWSGMIRSLGRKVICTKRSATRGTRLNCTRDNDPTGPAGKYNCQGHSRQTRMMSQLLNSPPFRAASWDLESVLAT